MSLRLCSKARGRPDCKPDTDGLAFRVHFPISGRNLHETCVHRPRRAILAAGKGEMKMHALITATAAAILLLAPGQGNAAMTQALGPEGRVYAVQSSEGRYTVQFRRGGRYEDTRPRSGQWNFDGRTLCVLVNAASRTQPEYEFCTPWRDLAVGESYDSRGWTGDESQARISRVE